MEVGRIPEPREPVLRSPASVVATETYGLGKKARGQGESRLVRVAVSSASVGFALKTGGRWFRHRPQLCPAPHGSLFPSQ